MAAEGTAMPLGVCAACAAAFVVETPAVRCPLCGGGLRPATAACVVARLKERPWVRYPAERYAARSLQGWRGGEVRGREPAAGAGGTAAQALVTRVRWACAASRRLCGLSAELLRGAEARRSPGRRS